jgi:hypothetical protein
MPDAMNSIAQQTLSSFGLGVALPPVATVAPIQQNAALYRRQSTIKTATCGYLSLANGSAYPSKLGHHLAC